MKGKSIFTSNESRSIKEHLVKLRISERNSQKSIRAHLRRKFHFYISDYTDSNVGFTEADFDNLVTNRMITIKG